jgi:hypothetical protein
MKKAKKNINEGLQFNLFNLLFCLSCVLLLSSCAAQEQSTDNAPRSTESAISVQDGETVIRMDKGMQNRSGLQVAALRSVSHQTQVKAYGTVIPLPDVSDLISRYYTAQADLKRARANSMLVHALLHKAQANTEVSQQEYQRLQELNADNKNISDKVLESANAAFKVNSADVSSAQGSIRANAADILAAQGALNSVKAAAIQRIGPTLAGWLFTNSPVFQRLLSRQDVLVQVNFPVEAGISKPPGIITIKSPNGQTFQVKFVSPALQTDPKIQEQSYYYIASADQEGLFPGMSLIATFPTKHTLKGVLIPKNAVVLWQGRSWVYLQKPDGEHFSRHAFLADTTTPEGWFDNSPMLSNRKIIVTGAELLLTEEFKAQMQSSGQSAE